MSKKSRADGLLQNCFHSKQKVQVIRLLIYFINKDPSWLVVGCFVQQMNVVEKHIAK
jgi:hypothetical protein